MNKVEFIIEFMGQVWIACPNYLKNMKNRMMVWEKITYIVPYMAVTKWRTSLYQTLVWAEVLFFCKKSKKFFNFFDNFLISFVLVNGKSIKEFFWRKGKKGGEFYAVIFSKKKHIQMVKNYIVNIRRNNLFLHIEVEYCIRELHNFIHRYFHKENDKNKRMDRVIIL